MSTFLVECNFILFRETHVKHGVNFKPVSYYLLSVLLKSMLSDKAGTRTSFTLAGLNFVSFLAVFHLHSSFV